MHDDTIVPEDDRMPFVAERAKAGDPVCTAEGKRVLGGLEYHPGRAYPFSGHLVGSRQLGWDEMGLYWGNVSFDPRNLRMIRQPAIHYRQHASDCATNNAPALPPGPYDCAAASTRYDPALCEPFDRARAENGAAVCDGNGVPHRIICFDRKDGNCPIITLSMSGGREVVHSFSNSGRFGNSSMATAADLRMAPLKTKRWWIVSWKKSRDERPVDGRSGCSEMFATQDAAETYARNICPRHSPATVSYTDITDDSNA